MNNEFVEQVDTISGALLEVIHNTAMQMFYSRSLMKLRTIEELTNAERIAGLRDLGNWVSSSTFLSSAMIYNAWTDTMYTSGGGHTTTASQYFPDRDTFELMVAREKHGSIGPIKRQTADGETYSFLFFERNIPNGGTLLLNVRANWYEHQLLGISSDHNSVIVGDDGEILVARDELLSEQVRQIWPTLLERFEEASSHGFILQPRSRSGWMYYQLSNLGVYYLRAFDTDTLLPGLTKIRNFTLVVLMVVTSILIGGALYTLFALYLPFKAVREALQKVDVSEESMTKRMDHLLETHQEQHLTKQVERLLQGEEVEIISFPASLILVECADLDLLRKTVQDSTPCPTLTTTTPWGCAVLISDSTEQDTLELCLKIANVIDCRCLYGEPKHSATELSQCYENLTELWQQRFLYAGQKVLSEKLTTAYHEPIEFSTKDIEPLFNFLRAGQLDQARTCWREIFSKIRHTKFSDFRFFIRYIIKHLNGLLDELELEPQPNAPDILDDLEDVAELHQLLDCIFQSIVAEQNHRRKDSLKHLANKVNERILAGFSDNNLSAQSIADEMGMNAVYLGRLYRESTGMSIADKIKITRIDNAKRLLKDTSAPVKEIAAQVGFSNTKYFFVVFKELVGMTPKEFSQDQKRKI
ncbi:MAG: helix-turn-helix transcriptional regulator [Firmicutes bacterium]|nr:helix-turn-helix transcriptional regulator [Bacillota bacterium]